VTEQGLRRASRRARVRNLVHSYESGWRAQSNVVCILGPHRSGTSSVARVLNLLGVYLGAEGDLIPPRPDNPRGFWEHSGLKNMNGRIFLRMGYRLAVEQGEWCGPPDWPDGWEDSPRLRGVARRTDLMLRMHFGNAPLWGWKDPRTCLTLPFWQRLIPEMRYVICLRNPCDVADSLLRRNGLSLEAGYELWLAHMRAALDYTAGRPRIVVRFKTLIEHTDEQVERLAAFLGVQEHARMPTVRAAIHENLDLSLWHSQTPFDREDPRVPEGVRELFSTVADEASEPVAV